MQKIPQIYPTNIAPYSKYYCTVHIVHFTEGWVGVEGDICDKIHFEEIHFGKIHFKKYTLEKINFGGIHFEDCCTEGDILV